MKKRLLSVLLLVCMVLTLLPTAAFAEDMHEHDALPAAAHTHCFCGGNVNAGDHTSHSNVTYKAWNGTSISYTNNTAYVYLTNNITLNSFLSLQLGKTLYLCLNGYTLNLEGSSYIWIGSKGAALYLCDCSAEKTGTVSGGSNYCVSVDDNIYSNAAFNMYGGTLRDGKKSHGGGVDVHAGTMNMYGGTITENTATSDGGGIFVNTSGALNLYGGTITKNKVNTNEDHHGGGVYVESNFKTGVGKISISGSPVITGNTRTYTPTSTTTTENVYLSYGFTNSGDLPIIKLGTLTSGANIGVSTKKATAFSTASETDYSDYFFSDDAGYHVEYNADKKLELKSGAAHVHSGGTATCTEQAICVECNKPYGSLNPNNHSGTLGDWQSDSTEHWKEYSCCKAKMDTDTHTGGTADCRHKAVCETCDREYGDLAAHDFTAQVAGEQYLTSAADCEQAAVYYKSCTVCGLSSKGMDGEATFTSGNILGHDWGAWTSNSDGTHTRTCKRDASHTETGDCTGGTADCQHKAVCETCGGAYGDLASHNFTAETVDGKYLKSAATCTEKAVYYKSCSTCGLTSKGTADEATFESGSILGHAYGDWTSNGNGTHTRVCANNASHTETGDCTGGTADCQHKAVCETCGGAYGDLASHNFTAETVDGKYLKSAATCTEKAVYYKSCSTCGLTSKGTADEATFESGSILGHAYGDWTSNGNGTHTRVCANNASHTETGDCTGGTADCTNKAVCTVCGGAYGAKDPSHHTGKLAWDITETHHEQAWTCCGLITVAKAAHTFGDWVVTKRPTSREEGEKARTCSVCGYTETKVLPKTGGGPTYYTLVFESNGGSKITNVNERHGTVVDLTLAKYQPTRTGYDFTGWYSDKTLTRRVTSIKLYENTTVYAGWSVRNLPFTDVVRGDWFFDDVRYVYETGLMNGVSATRFAPYGSTTRGMIVTILYRMEGQPAVSRDCPFTDVASGSYYERAITWAAANGIVTGHSSTIFAPDASITREQLAAILYRYAVYKGLDVSAGENTNILSYEDFASLSEYAIPAMQWACGAGVLYGFGGSLLPDAPANRLQAAAILHRFCVNILN